MDIVYFLICVLGGFFVVGIPWSGFILILLRREGKKLPAAK